MIKLFYYIDIIDNNSGLFYYAQQIISSLAKLFAVGNTKYLKLPNNIILYKKVLKKLSYIKTPLSLSIKNKLQQFLFY